MDIIDILNGHVNEILNNNEDLFNERMKICRRCPLYIATKLGPMCNNKLWIDKNSNISKEEKKDYVRGCGCRLDAKLRVPHAKCIINKW